MGESFFSRCQPIATDDTAATMKMPVAAKIPSILERREEHEQRPQIQQPAGGSAGSCCLLSSALRRRARRSKGCRSSSPSPTPMKCTGKAEAGRQRHQDAALGGAVQLGHDQAGERHGRLEGLDLGDRVLAGGGIQHQQHGMRRGGIAAS